MKQDVRLIAAHLLAQEAGWRPGRPVARAPRPRAAVWRAGAAGAVLAVGGLGISGSSSGIFRPRIDPAAFVQAGSLERSGGIHSVSGESSMTRTGKLVGSTVLASFAAFGHPAVADRFMGPVQSWGLNVAGSCDVPADLTDCVSIHSGGYQTVALRADGSVRSWGWNAIATPAEVGPCLAVASGEYHVLALRTDRSVRAWGNLNNSRQLDVPVDVLAPGSVIGIGASGWANGVIKSDGTVRCWGNDESGQQSVPANASPALVIGVGVRHYLAIRTDRSVVAWGAGTSPIPNGDWDRGQCAVPSDLGPCASVQGGGLHSLALRFDGTVRAWGDNRQGQCAIPPNLGSCSEIAAGGTSSCALRQDGSVVAWGKVFIGGGIPQNVSVPSGLGRCAHVSIGASTVSAIRADPGCAADLDRDGSVTGSDISLLLLDFGDCGG